MTQTQTGNDRDDDLLQQFCIKYVNKKVKEFFKDIPDTTTSETTPRAISKRLCLHKDNDPLTLTVARLITYQFIMNGFDDGEGHYSIPITDFHSDNTFYPQVTLRFQEEYKEWKDSGRKNPLKARVSWRLTNSVDSKAEALTLANRIKAELATPIFKFHKGEIKVSYIDQKNGFNFILSAYSKEEAKRLISAVLSVAQKTPDWDLLNVSVSDKNFKANTKISVMGKLVDAPKRRQIGYVRFTHAELKIHGVRDTVLVDTTTRYKSALVKL